MFKIFTIECGCFFRALKNALECSIQSLDFLILLGEHVLEIAPECIIWLGFSKNFQRDYRQLKITVSTECSIWPLFSKFSRRGGHACLLRSQYCACAYPSEEIFFSILHPCIERLEALKNYSSEPFFLCNICVYKMWSALIRISHSI